MTGTQARQTKAALNQSRNSSIEQRSRSDILFHAADARPYPDIKLPMINNLGEAAELSQLPESEACARLNLGSETSRTSGLMRSTQNLKSVDFSSSFPEPSARGRGGSRTSIPSSAPHALIMDL